MVNHNSWEYYDDSVAIKKTDITVYRSGESGIPVYVKSFFGIEDITPDKEYDITLILESESYAAKIYMIGSNRQSKIDWAPKLTAKLRTLVPNYYNHRNYPYLIFKKKDATTYEIELVQEYDKNIYSMNSKSNVSNDTENNTISDGINVNPVDKNSTVVCTPQTNSTDIEKYLRENHSGGFEFDSILDMILSEIFENYNKSDLETIRDKMFMRKDQNYFFIENVADSITIQELTSDINGQLSKFGLFEIVQLYKKYQSKINKCIILDLEDFADYVRKIIGSNINIVSYDMHRIGKSITINKDDALGSFITHLENSIKESDDIKSLDDLKTEFNEYSEEFLIYALNHSSKYVKTTINEITYYQSEDATVLPNDLNKAVTESVEKLDSCSLEINTINLNTALSLYYNENFISEYCHSDTNTFKKIIDKSYDGCTRHWKRNIFDLE